MATPLQSWHRALQGAELRHRSADTVLALFPMFRYCCQHSWVDSGCDSPAVTDQVVFRGVAARPALTLGVRGTDDHGSSQNHPVESKRRRMK